MTSSNSSKSGKWWVGPVIGIVVAGMSLAMSWGIVKAEMVHLKETSTRIEVRATTNTNDIIEIKIEQGKVITLLKIIADDVRQIKDDLKN